MLRYGLALRTQYREPRPSKAYSFVSPEVRVVDETNSLTQRRRDAKDMLVKIMEIFLTMHQPPFYGNNLTGD